jgi:hypothetical protein
MKKLICIFFALLFGVASISAQNKTAKGQGVTLKGVITEYGTDAPLEMVTVNLPEYGLWATTNSKGQFTINRVPKGTTTLKISCLGYQGQDMTLKIEMDMENLKFKLKEDNLTLSSVTVTAQESKSAATTTRMMEKQAIEHLQVVNATDILSLLPGGTTTKNSLTDASVISLRGDDAVTGGFGTAVMMDGIKLSNNASMLTFDDTKRIFQSNDLSNKLTGVDTRFLAASNIESVEVITGVPSVEYGDMTSGMVLINTKRGKTPYTATISINPKTKQFSASKGFELGNDKGIMNISAEYAKAFSNPVSRYTTYYRNNYSVNYVRTFNKTGRPLKVDLTLAGGFAKQHAKQDPDAYKNTWQKQNQSNLRFGADVKWLINAPWITSLEGKGSISYENGTEKENDFYAYSTIIPGYSSLENGYYEMAYLPNNFYYLTTNDSKPFDASLGLKATWNRKFGTVNNNMKLGVDWANSQNMGDGISYLATNSSTNVSYPGISMNGGVRDRSYKEIPALNTYSAYLEDVASIPFGQTMVTAVAGLRAERQHLRNMQYNNPSALSPRFNLKWSLMREKRSGFLRSFTIRGAWGQLTKLPSLGILYPLDNYRDIVVYSKNYNTSNYFYAVNTQVYKNQENKDLKWAKNRNIELGFDVNLGGVKVSAIYFNNKAKNTYTTTTDYAPYAYVRTNEQTSVPANPSFRIDNSTGDVFVTDLDNPTAGETLLPKSVLDTTFVGNTKANNLQPITTQGIELTIDFGTIKPLRTSVIADARYEYTKNLDTRLVEYYASGLPHSTLGAQGRSYQFVAYYVGSNMNRVATYNGSKKDFINANVTFVTHIPEIRLTISTRIEAQFYERDRNLTYYNGKEWAYLVDDSGNRVSGSVYHQKQYITGAWPVAYKTLDGTVRPFTEKEASDPVYASLISYRSSKSTYVTDGNGPYFSANISITKEIGKIASISFFANNCSRSMHRIKYWSTGMYQMKNANFTYGATLRLKF